MAHAMGKGRYWFIGSTRADFVDSSETLDASGHFAPTEKEDAPDVGRPVVGANWWCRVRGA
jgi:hypothetical protein